MQDREKIYLTKEGKEKLLIELEDLEGPTAARDRCPTKISY